MPQTRVMKATEPEMNPRRPELCHVTVDVRGLEARPFDAVRVLLVADVLRRQAEGVGCHVLLHARGPRSVRGDGAPISAKELGILEPTTRSLSATPTDGASGPPDVVVTVSDPAESRSPDVVAPRTVHVGPVKTSGGVRAEAVHDILAHHDPLALRLVLLRFQHASPAMVSSARLRRADETLHRWRYKVADWADMPSGVLTRGLIERLHHTLADDLDTPSALKVLHRLEIDHSIASGSKFDAFAAADRVLALDLCHLVGRLRL